MPEGPEVRRYADQLSRALSSKRIMEIGARTKHARAWLTDRGDELIGKEILSVHAHGKNIIGLIEGDYFFYSHQMMWGRWHLLSPKEANVADRRERARIKVKNKVAVLMSAPIFEVGEGDPYNQIRYLRDLGPNILTYGAEKFDRTEFLRRLQSRANMSRTIGAALLDQSIAAGVGNYLRAEIMFIGKINPWTEIGNLSEKQKESLCSLIPTVADRSYLTEGVTVTDALQARMRSDTSLVYVPGKEYGTHHYVFRRTNLPCLICGEKIRQLRQTLGSFLGADDEGSGGEGDGEDKTRIVYFCANCQGVDVDAVKVTRKRVG